MIVNYQYKLFNSVIVYVDVKSTGCSLKIVFFPKNVVIFLNSASSAAALVFYLPGVTLTPREKKKPEYFKAQGRG